MLNVWIGDKISQETPLYAAETVGSRYSAATRARCRRRIDGWLAALNSVRLASADLRRLPACQHCFGIDFILDVHCSKYDCRRRSGAADMLGRHGQADLARGFFITFEGGEGAGKSTQIGRLANKLRDKRYPVVVTREPGGSPGAEAIRHVILSGAAEPFGPEMEALLFAAARSDHVEQLIRPALRRGKIVLCDRFVDSLARLSGCRRQRRCRAPGRDRACIAERRDARHDADLRYRCGGGAAACSGAPRRGPGRPLREGDARRPQASPPGFSGHSAERARTLHS